MRLGALTDRLDDELRTDEFADVDGSANGLQIGDRDGEIERVAVAVDGVAETARRAVAADADLLVAHHGISWGGIERITGRAYDRVSAFLDEDLALYVSHLPLDAHPELGNAAGLADAIGLAGRDPFGQHGPEYLGCAGSLAEPTTPAALRDRLADNIHTGPGTVRLLDFGPERIEDVAILTGAGADWFDEAVAAGVDCYVTGEGQGRLYHEAREAGVSVLLGGHYATETFGVRSLADLIEGWGIETEFLDVPTGL
ncbi:Nif3-like dinuclear metal center hexameric protein [Halobacteriales archaeon SW_7_68_16]|nr:MAG: Nif3-like dinuclear metal center hexameric protein [Halobacteriales archaeon SW_7_68_16]